MNKLRLSRVPVNIKATYYLKKTKGECRITDISEGGVGIETNQLFVEGDLVRLIFDLDEDLHIDMWGIVRNVNGSKVGIEYEELPFEKRERLKRFITDLLIKLGKSKYEPY